MLVVEVAVSDGRLNESRGEFETWATRLCTDFISTHEGPLDTLFVRDVQRIRCHKGVSLYASFNL
jgi:hypothetical protein